MVMELWSYNPFFELKETLDSDKYQESSVILSVFELRIAVGR